MWACSVAHSADELLLWGVCFASQGGVLWAAAAVEQSGVIAAAVAGFLK